MEKTCRMSKKVFEAYEVAAMLEGGAAAGQFLDSIGQTDLAELNQDQFLLFFSKYAGGYEDSMRRQMGELKDAY